MTADSDKDEAAMEHLRGAFSELEQEIQDSLLTQIKWLVNDSPFADDCDALIEELRDFFLLGGDMAETLQALVNRDPDGFHDALRSIDLPPARRGKPPSLAEWRQLLAAFMLNEGRLGKVEFCNAYADVVCDDPDDSLPENLLKKLRRAERLYATDKPFRKSVHRYMKILEYAKDWEKS